MTVELTFEPVGDGYSVEPSYPVLETILDGTTYRKRQDQLYSPHRVSLNWVLSPVNYTLFMGFFRNTLSNGTKVFLLDLVTDIAAKIPHRCRCAQGLPKLTGKTSNSLYVSCELEVEPNPTYTGLITYQEPGNIIFVTSQPTLVGRIQAGDFVQIVDSEGTHPTGPTDLNLDGVYEVGSTTGDSQLSLNSANSVNADWTVLSGLAGTAEYGDADHGNVISTVVRIPT